MKTKLATELERELHSLIIKGDDLALSQLFDLHGEKVISALKSWYRSVKDDAIIHHSVNEALLGYYRNPSTFDPDKNTLLRFLEIAAERDLQNFLEKEKKYKNSQNIVGDVELEIKTRNRIKIDDITTDGEVILKESLKEIDIELSNYFNTKKDILMAKLILFKERDTNEFALILGLNEMDQSEKRREVKRNKDRIKKVLDRNHVLEKIRLLING